MSTHRPVALITGASRGIGKGIALSLAKAGFDVVGTARSLDALLEVSKEVAALGARFVPVAGDIDALDQHPRMVAEALALAGRVDCFVSNAGMAPQVRADILEMTPESFDQVLGVNLRGATFFAQAVAKAMLGTGASPNSTSPCLVFITSISARVASINRTEYCVSKAGLSMVAKSFAVRLAPHGINVYELQPGIIATDMTAGVQEKYDRLIENGLLLTPRWGTPEDIGRAVASLAKGDLAYSTGSVIELGGGYGVEWL